MKTASFLRSLVVLTFSGFAASFLIAEELEVIEAGADYRVIQSVRTELDPQGETFSVTNRYTEVGSGLNYWDGTAYVESVPGFAIIGGAAVADQGQHTIVLAANLNSQGSVYVLDRDGREYRSTPVMLALRNPQTGEAGAIAFIQDTIGELVADDQVLYRSAFQGVEAAVRITNRRDGTEQDIILYEPLNPLDWGFPENSLLEVWTETFSWPAPNNIQATTAGSIDDVKLDFGTFQIGQGKAFALEGAGTEVPIGKRFGPVGGRNFLVERVPFLQLKPLLDQLPYQAQVDGNTKRKRMAQFRRTNHDQDLVASAVARPLRLDKGQMVAEIRRSTWEHRPGVLLDYATVSGTSFTFTGDTTYLVNSTVNLTSATFVGGAVIKMDSAPTAMLNLTGPVECRTTRYRPLIVTAKTDNTVGESIAASDTASPLPRNYGTPALKLNYSGAPFYLHDVAIRRATTAIRLELGSLSLTNAQIVSCGAGFFKASTATTLDLKNVLVDDVGVLFDAAGTSGGANTVQHLTAHRVSTFGQGTFASAALYNSLLISVTNYIGFYTDPNTSVTISASDTGIFASPVGAGNHYLASGSSLRGMGKAISDPQFAAEIASRTTYPPSALSGSISTPLVLAPRTPRDFGLPDPGYHYAVADFLLTDVEAYGGITLTNGVTVACAGNFGIRLPYSVALISEGYANALNRIVSYCTVQEQATVVAVNSGSRKLIEVPTQATPNANLRLRFTETSLMAGEGSILYLGDIYSTVTVSSIDAKDCWFRGGRLWANPNTAGMTINLVNDLFEGCDVVFTQNYPTYVGTQPMSLGIRNCLFKWGTLVLRKHSLPSIWSVSANLFDTTITSSVGNSATIGNVSNGYRSTATQIPGASNSKLISNFNYLRGPYGDFYYTVTPAVAGSLTDLVGAGDMSPAVAGLSYRTIDGTTLAPDNGTLVAVGYHYIATSAAGVPLDTDGDGLPNYYEDANGDGLLSAGETNAGSPTSSNGFTTDGLIVFTPLK